MCGKPILFEQKQEEKTVKRLVRKTSDVLRNKFKCPFRSEFQEFVKKEHLFFECETTRKIYIFFFR